jgi:hypothetical protein
VIVLKEKPTTISSITHYTYSLVVTITSSCEREMRKAVLDESDECSIGMLYVHKKFGKICGIDGYGCFDSCGFNKASKKYHKYNHRE